MTRGSKIQEVEMHKIVVCGGVVLWETVQPMQARKHGRYMVMQQQLDFNQGEPALNKHSFG